ncbi:MAG: hypothetical protein IKB71_12165 [Lentisphaeria bacterium]|nr:hypothetical protein [Lentisphaeria bacterium]
MIKKYLSALLVGCCLLSFGSSNTVDEFKFYPASYLRFWENNLKNYWRYENSVKEKKSDPGVEIILNEFRQRIGMLAELLKISGLHDIEKISGKSEEFKNSNGDIHFKNKITFEFDDDGKGFLKALFSKLPKDKIPDLSDNEKEINDLHIIKDNTLFAFELPFNFNAVMETAFKESACGRALDVFARQNLKMPLVELADALTGVWGGIVNINRINEGENAGKFTLDFMFVIPDPEKKFFRRLGEYLILNRMAYYKDKMLKLHILSSYREMFMMPSENFLIVASSPDFIGRLSETAEKKEIGLRLKKLEVPMIADDESYIFWNREFEGFANTFVHHKPYALKFMEDFAGNDVFNTIIFDDDEIEIIQYATAPFSQMLVSPFSVSMMVHYDLAAFKKGRQKYFADKLASMQRKCADDMRFFAEKLLEYRKKNGKYPDGINAEGLKKLAAYGKIPAEKFSLKTGKNKTVPFGRYYYWGENHLSSRADMPLMCDCGNVHKNKIHIIFCDGSVREFELENIRSAKRIASFLHTVFKYDSAAFAMLLKQAERLDREKL